LLLTKLPVRDPDGLYQLIVTHRSANLAILEVGDPRNMALYIDDFVNPPFVTVSEADDSGIGHNPARVRSRNREEPCVMECLNQVLKSLRGDEVMLFAGDSATAEALIVDMAPAPEIDAESRATQAESVAFRVRKDDVVQFRLRTASDQG
jgi:hypothetical protein